MEIGRWRAIVVGVFVGMLLVAAPATPALAAPPAAPSPESEPNGTSATATTIVSGQRARGDIFPAADVDFYKFTATAGDKVYAATMTSGSAEQHGLAAHAARR